LEVTVAGRVFLDVHLYCTVVSVLATRKFPLVQAFRVVMWSHATVMLSIDTDRTEDPTRVPGENTDLPVILGKRC